ncbi:MAG: xylulose kinase [Lentisphaerae bacterium]|nr:xylulose kinase [Lentisphaerota bacterium]
MPRQRLIGIDIGTQGTKAALFDGAGRCLASAFEPSRLHRPSVGAVEEDPERQVASVCRTMRSCAQRAGVREVAAIGIDGQMAGIIGMGRDGRAVTPYDSWLDQRCAPYIDEMRSAAGREIIAKTGGPASFNHGPKILRWQREFPRVFRAIAAFVQPGGYAALRLCGLSASEAFIDKTYLHFSGFADNRRGRWDEGLCRRFGVPTDKLPRIIEPHAVVGRLTPAMARACGLRTGIPVVAGCGDTAASFLACGATRPGICVDVAGTASVFASTTSEFRADVRHGTLGWGQAATPGLWHPYAYINGGGMNLEWFRKELGHGASFAVLDRRAAAVPPSADNPYFIPHLTGRVAPSQPHLRGAWAGLRADHTFGHLYRALLEGVALEYGLYASVLRELEPSLRPRELRVTGGGERSALWNAIKADVLGCRVVRMARGEGAPMGVALVAGFGVGLFPSLNEAATRWIRTGAAVMPDGRRRAHYAARLGRYIDLLDSLNDWSQA